MSVNVKRGTSPSKAIDGVIKANWKGGLDHGTTNVKQALQSHPTKHPIKPKSSK